ncbi:hypothetical protein ACHAXT_000215 [Thalassiosira profunda]
MMAVDESEYTRAVAWAAAVLTIKMMVLHLAVVRVRISQRLKGKFGNFDVTPEAQLETWQLGSKNWLYPLFYYSLGCFAGPYRTLNDMERFQAMERNAVENEPYFLLVAYAWAQFDVPAWGPAMIEYYVYSRVLHLVWYQIIRSQPWRALLWSAGVVINMVIAGNILMQK